jgi:SAM-dependent methyltransferase
VASTVDEFEPYARLASVYDEIVVDPCYDTWAAHLDRLWKSDPSVVQSVLDLGCGTGLMAAALSSRGYHVTGVDASPAMLDRARRLLGPSAKLYQRILPDLDISSVFDAAIATFDALNYLTPKELRTGLAAACAQLRPGGWLIFDLHTDAMRDFTVTHPTVSGSQDGRHFTISSVVGCTDSTDSVDCATHVCDTRIVVIGSGDDDNFAENHRQYFHRPADVLEAVRNAGCTLVSVTDEYSDRPADASTLRATWTARRAAR